MLSPDGPPVRAILLDIEGTTTPVSFVYETLFPYARRQMKDFLVRHWEDAAVRADVAALRKQHELDAPLGPPPWRDGPRDAQLDSAVAYAGWLSQRDSKCTPLKSLQGKVCEEGYRSGELRGEVYPDVPRAFARWTTQRKVICIYSSGSILAQKLLFSTTASGDLTPHIRFFFDTAVGTKTDAESYRRIAASIGSPASEILFLSDVARELDAARQAGMQTSLCLRPGSIELPASAHPVIRSFEEVFPE